MLSKPLSHPGPRVKFRNLPILGVRQLPNPRIPTRGLGPQQSIPPGGLWQTPFGEGGEGVEMEIFVEPWKQFCITHPFSWQYFWDMLNGKLWEVETCETLELYTFGSNSTNSKHLTKVGAEDDFPFNIWSSNLWSQTPADRVLDRWFQSHPYNRSAPSLTASFPLKKWCDWKTFALPVGAILVYFQGRLLAVSFREGIEEIPFLRTYMDIPGSIFRIPLPPGCRPGWLPAAVVSLRSPFRGLRHRMVYSPTFG